jgi:hypothetical protein
MSADHDNINPLDQSTAGSRHRSGSGAPSIVALARDPTLITGVYETCDQWCTYCRVTDRCLAFRSTNAADVGGVFGAPGSTGESIEDTPRFLKALADAEGRLAPPEIEAVLSGDRERWRAAFTLDDPLERLGRRYMTLADAYLGSRPDFPSDGSWRPEGPTAIEVLAWYHVLVPARVFRAILSDAEAGQGVPGRRRDALRAARVALVGMDRSARALADVWSEDDDPRLPLLQRLLNQLRDAVEARFPEARDHIQPELDAEPRTASRVRRGLRRLHRLLHWPGGRSDFDTASGNLRGPGGGPGSPRG